MRFKKPACHPVMPSFGPYEDDMPMRVFLDATIGELFADDPDDIAKIPILVTSFKRHVKVMDMGDLIALPLSGWTVALGRALEATEVKGMLRLLLRHLGPEGRPHIPPSTSSRPASPLPFRVLTDFACAK